MNKVLKQRPVVLLSLLTATPETYSTFLNIEQVDIAAYLAAEVGILCKDIQCKSPLLKVYRLREL